MKASAMLFATDLADEGHDVVLGRLRERAGLDALTIACNYHHSRDVFPHNPVRKVRFFTGEVWFQPTPGAYGDGIQPPVAPEARDEDPLARAVAEARERGLGVRGWTNNTHNSRLGLAHPDAVVRTPFGDPLVFALCPANPAVRRYVCALQADLARHGLDALILETLGFLPFDHGWHHERTPATLGPTDRFLFGLCWCEHCQAAAVREGVDVERVGAWLRTQLEAALGGEARAPAGVPLERAAVEELADGELAGVLRARERTVTGLMEEVVAAVRAVGDVPVLYMDVSGGLRASGSGMEVASADAAAPGRAWQDGTDLAAVADAGDGLSMIGYSTALEQLELDLDAYLAHVAPERLSVALRPTAPDVDGPRALAAKLARLEDAGVAWVDFYHYGFMPLASLDWIAEARRSPR